jgi:hypothetical protein
MIHAPPSRPRAEALAQVYLKHLDEERVVLETTLRALHQIRVALVHGGAMALNRALEEQAEPVRAGARLADRREDLRRELAVLLGIAPEAVTLQGLADLCPPNIRARLLEIRARLHQLAAEVDVVNRGNAVLVNHSLGFLEQLLSGITGSAGSGKRYGPAGAYQQPAWGSLVSARG